MTWWAAGIAGAVLVVLHAIAWKRPPHALLPTARFLPVVSLPSRSRRFIPSDVALLALRLAALALAAAALESPPRLPRSSALARVIVLDASRAVLSTQERDESVRAATLDAESVRLVAFDSTTRSLSSSGIDVVGSAPVAGRLAAGLVSASREVARLKERFERVDVVVVSPVVEEEWSPAIGAIVATMGAPVRWTRIAAATPVDTGQGAGSLPSPDSPLGAAAWHALGAARPGVRVREGSPDAADSASARAGGVVAWFRPASDTGLSAQGVYARGAVAIGGYARGTPGGDGIPVAWWSDGAAAATEKSLGMGCVREVAVGLPVRGDEMLRPAFASMLRELLAPCGAERLTPVPASWLPAGAVSTADRPAATDLSGRRLLIVLALVALAAEIAWRRRIERGARATGAETSV